ncbi:MAG: hypothetical protein Q9216_000627 [Gyalolechia sp. 2 TL-2023]
MNPLRLARVAARVQSTGVIRTPLQKRSYADAVSDKIQLTLALPHQRSASRIQVNVPAESGEMGVLANHVPSIEQLKPGLVEIIEESGGGSKQFFCWVWKGLVSARIHAYQVHAQQANDVAQAYLPSLPRARFESVQTRGGWPSSSTDLYNQVHPRTMSLACESSQCDTTISHGTQFEHTSRGESQTGSITSNSPRVTSLLHLWESKGQEHRVLPSRWPSNIARLRKDLALVDRPAHGGHHSYRSKFSTEVMEVPHSTNLSLPYVNLCSLRSGQKTAGSKDLSKTPDEPLPGLPAKLVKHDVTACRTPGVTDSNDRKVRNNFHYPPGNHPSGLEKGCMSAGSSLVTERRMPVQGGKHVSCWQQINKELDGQKAVKRTTRNSSSSHARLEALTCADTKIHPGKLSGSLLERLNQDRGLLFRQGAGFGGASSRHAGGFEVPEMPGPHDIHRASAAAEANVTHIGKPSRSSRSRLPEMSLISPDDIPCRVSSALTSSALSSLLDVSVRPWGVESRFPSAKNGVTPAQRVFNESMHTPSPTSTSSSNYFSVGSKPDSDDSREDHPIAENATAPKQAIHDSMVLNMSSMSDAATQTDTVKRETGKSTSAWSDKDPVGWRRRRAHPRQRISGDVRLERRLKRSTVHKVEMIVSLDGTTESQWKDAITRGGGVAT